MFINVSTTLNYRQYKMSKKEKTKIKYTTISVPDFLMERIDSIVEQREKYGYQNRTDFVFEAIREKLRKIGALE
jgi:metal-responsive CopG/Arc/MetJ family transcriptional regulator